MNRFYRLKKYIGYLWKAQSKYYLHSPFVFSFYNNVLEGKNDVDFSALNRLREQLSNDQTLIDFTDFGTGISGKRNISEIEKAAVIRQKYGELLCRLASHFKPKHILELGTSLGISSAYMAIGQPDAEIISLEGCKAISERAKKTHLQLGINIIDIEEGNFDSILPGVIKKKPGLDLVFFDGNHTKEATLLYFEMCLGKVNDSTVFIFDDIYRSPEMTEAWEQIKGNKQITITIDIFQWGICFFRKENLAKENFALLF